jgi:DNA-binding transcriptional ArsR family regulator
VKHETAVARARRLTRKEIERIDTLIAQYRESVTAIQDEVRKMEDARAALAAELPHRNRSPSSRKIAGPKAIARVSEVLAGVGRTTQAEITRATGLNSGTITHSLAVLEDDGLARRTGRKDGRSEEWAWLGPVATARGRRTRQAA